MNIDIIKSVIKNTEELLILSETSEYAKNLEKNICNQNVSILLVDDLFDLYALEHHMFVKDKYDAFIFINDNYNKKEFTTTFTKHLLKIFEERNEFKPVIIYPQNNFKLKNGLSKISQICRPFINKSNVESKESAIFYVGQYGTSGYASAAKGYIADYILKQQNITWHPLKFDDSRLDDQYYIDNVAKSVVDRKYTNYNKVILHSTPDLWPEFKNRYKKLSNNIHGYCTWETNKLPQSWVNHINCIEEVMVPSIFNKQAFIESGVTSNITVVPHLWFPQKLIDKKNIVITDFFGNVVPNDKYTFYCIAELNERKGISDLIETFDKIDGNNKQLILKLHYKNYEKENIDYCLTKISRLTKKLGKSIHLILKNINNSELLALHSFGDCLVSLNKGEGFGLTIFDAFNHGKRVITTGFGGQLDYLPKDYEGLVKYELVPVNGMNSFSKNYTSDQMWAQPDLEHALYLMNL